MMSRIVLPLLALMAAPAAAQAPQSRLLTVSADAPFVHAHSGLSIPATIIGLPRFEVRELEQPQLDVWARFRRDDTDELTVYVYRTTAGAVPVWFDRAANAVETRKALGTPTAVAPAQPIAPPGAAAATGLIQSWSLAGGPYSGTALAIAPIGDWLVKLRYSTTRGDGRAAEAKLREALTTLGWPNALPDAPAAAAVADCTTPIAFKGMAKSIAPDGASALLGAVMAEMSPTRENKTPPAVWCRDPAGVEVGGVYRPGGADDRYLLALSDAGRGAFVAPDMAGLLMGKRGRKAWSVSLVLPGQTVNYPAQNRLPAPARVVTLLQGPAMSSATTWGDKKNVTLSPSSLK